MELIENGVGGIWVFDDVELPEEWVFDQLGNRCTIRRGASPRPAGDPRYFGNGTIPWIKIGDATKTGSRYIESTEEHVNEAGAKCSVHIPEGSLIIANSGVSLGFAAITRVPGCIHDGWLLATDFRELDRDYLYYCINIATRRIRQLADGTTQPNLNTGIARHLMLPFPPLVQQKAIAHILGTLDDEIELNRRMNATLEAMARALFQSWFVDFDPVRAKLDGLKPLGLDSATSALFPAHFQVSPLGSVPQGWEVKPMSEVIEVNPRRTLRSGAIAPYLDMKNMPMQGHAADEVVAREFSSGSKFQNGDTLLARITPCLENGKTAFVDFLQEGQIGWGSTEYIVFTPKPPLTPEFGYYLARSDALRLHAIQNMTGTSGRQRVPSDCFAQFKLAVPPAKIAARFGEITEPWMRKIHANIEQSRTLATLRDTLLPKLLSGQIQPCL